ncbi:hypothetical protein ZTR_08870 [Talaromyces verruculosus]|nr:hypothetical protein ZTR_08870 [Talaromyces verruculosus]
MGPTSPVSTMYHFLSFPDNVRPIFASENRIFFHSIDEIIDNAVATSPGGEELNQNLVETEAMIPQVQARQDTDSQLPSTESTSVMSVPEDTSEEPTTHTFVEDDHQHELHQEGGIGSFDTIIPTYGVSGPRIEPSDGTSDSGSNSSSEFDEFPEIDLDEDKHGGEHGGEDESEDESEGEGEGEDESVDESDDEIVMVLAIHAPLGILVDMAAVWHSPGTTP